MRKLEALMWRMRAIGWFIHNRLGEKAWRAWLRSHYHIWPAIVSCDIDGKNYVILQSETHEVEEYGNFMERLKLLPLDDLSGENFEYQPMHHLQPPV